ncbi:type II toxin-antitoxin system VapB family antitoxin [uncultured Thiodictyon sp.]|uniref:type II toxin-antitoxin system VapB family antitoxin n=1 Tax=uncultured Thiodictyon sp. TaxID=1846217 RepID=UPI0025F562A1|nr:type II toxin-antitoxin system VapB family antitoxin [uncultured Thiodictyon sp.]
MVTRIFKSGNSLAVRIPKELAFAESVQEVEIERIGNTLVVRPVVQETIGDLTAILAAFPRDFMAEGREFHEQKERDWSAFSGKQPDAE